MKATNIIISFSTQPTGAVVAHQRAQLSICISDRLERLWLALIIMVAAMILASDDLLGQITADLQRNFDTWRLGIFILFTGARLCFADAAK